MLYASARDITERKQAETKIQELNRELEQRVVERTVELESANATLLSKQELISAIHEAQTEFITESSSTPPFDRLLGGLLKLTDSEYGFIDEMFHDENGNPYLIARAITDISWNDETRKMYAQFVSGELRLTNLKSLFGEVMTTGRAVIANDAPNDPRRGGRPAGHPALNAFLGLPLYSSGHLVGVIGLANRPDGYTDDLIAFLQPITTACANLIVANRIEQQRLAAEESLLQMNAKLEWQSGELVAANKELEAFSYSVSHDLRAPLRSIDSFSRIVIEDYEAQLDAEGQRLLNVVRSEAQRMGQLIDDLLSFSRLGRQEMMATQFDMASLAQDAYEDLPETSRQHVKRFTIGPLPPAYGDRSMIRQVWYNLLANAAKFTGSTPDAEIEVRGDTLDGVRNYCVKDNGAGFDPRYAHKLFGVFQRLHSESEFEGTGVGLALVQRIIHRHGGRVWADGHPNHGATFCFSLPTNTGIDHAESNHSRPNERS